MSEWRKRLKDFLEESEVTQDYLAEKMSVTQGTIAHWLSGRREINLTDFLQLCEWAGADAQRILFGGRAVAAEEPGAAELDRLLAAHPNLRARIARQSVSSDSVARALGPTPPRRAVRRGKTATARRRRKVQP